MKRGEVWWVNFEPSIGGEVKKQRPAVIFSNDISNKYLNRVQVVPLSPQVDKVYPSEAVIESVGKPGKALCDQITTVSKLRLSDFICTISTKDMEKIEKALKIQLGIG